MIGESKQIIIGNNSFPLKDEKARADIAANFSVSTSYAVGDLVLYDGYLYKFTSAHSAGAWIGTDAVQITVAGHLNTIDTALSGKVAKSGDTMTGNLTVNGQYYQKSDAPDATNTDNGLSSTVGYSFNRVDKNGLPIAYFDCYIRADGSIASAFGAINYNTSGDRVATQGLMVNVLKDGTAAWTVGAPDSFRSAIGAAPASNPVIINNPYEVTDSTILSLDNNDNLLIVCGKVVYCSVRFNMRTTTTGSTKAMAFKSEYSQYLPVNYSTGNPNGVVFLASECWNAATQGMVYLNGTWQMGISGGFQNGKGYIGTVTYFIN